MDTKDKIVQIRTGMGLNQTEFANTIGVSRGIISRVESGDRPATLKLLKKISDIHEIDLEWLQSDSKELFPVSLKGKDYEEYKQIVSFFQDPNNFVMINFQFYIDKIVFKTLDECKAIDIAMRKLTADQIKESTLFSKASLKTSYENIFNKIYDSFEEFEKAEESLNYDKLRDVIKSDKNLFVRFMISANSDKYKSVLHEIDIALSNSIDNDPNIILLLKHKILRPSVLAKLHITAAEFYNR